jgi:hypothetical protein
MWNCHVNPIWFVVHFVMQTLIQILEFFGTCRSLL